MSIKRQDCNGYTFDEWMSLVDKHIAAICGLGYLDLADICYYDYYESEMPASEVALIALENEGFPF